MAAPKEVDMPGCDDFAVFQDVLKRLRLIDDRIINALNTSLPTESFKEKKNSEEQCKQFCDQVLTLECDRLVERIAMVADYHELMQAHSERSHIIKRCITEVSDIVSTLRKQRESGADDPAVTMKLRSERNKLRMMQAELNVEEIVRDRSLKVFYERCRLIYLPQDFHMS